MLAPKVAKPGTKAASPTHLAPQRSLLVARSVGGEREHAHKLPRSFGTQANLGNQATLRLLGQRARIQPKLMVGDVDDPLEREADRTADRVMRAADIAGPVSSLPSIRHDESSPDVSGIVEQGLSGGGRPLANSVKAEMEPKFGLDLSGVRIHAGSPASRSAEQLSAKAYTIGPNIVFRAGGYAPGSAEGKRLLAHELTHVAQQGDAATLNSAGNIGMVQRDPLASVNPPDVPASFPPPPGTPQDYSKMAWPDLLPHAHRAKDGNVAKIDLHTPDNKIDTWGTGQAPTLNYVADKDIVKDHATAEPQNEGGMSTAAGSDTAEIARQAAFTTAQDTCLSQIRAARAKIPNRPMAPSINNNAGYDYNPDKDPAAADYNTWAKSALPTGVAATDWNWQVFQKIKPLEGQEGRFTTFDKTLSVGPGNSTSGGQTQQVLGKTFKLLPEVKSVAFDAGLTVDPSGAMSVVDTDKKWILDGQDAAAYLQVELALLSLLVNVSQGTQPVDASGTVAPGEQTKQRQGLLDAEFQQFVNVTLNGADAVKGWPLDSAVLAVHAKHAQPGNFPYGFWSSRGSDLSSMVAAIYAKVGDSAKYICTGPYVAYRPKSSPAGG
jgi:hypothetical protein